MLMLISTDIPGIPGQPEIIEIGKAQATLTWTAPKSDGGSPITNYRIEMRTAGAYRWDMVNITERTARTKYVVKGLMDETDYEFRVSAENKAGVSAPSPASRSAKYGTSHEFTFDLYTSLYEGL